jgi:excisionase family DNA binding protein
VSQSVWKRDEQMTEESRSGGVAPLGSASAGGKFLTVAEVAATLRVSKMSVYRLIHSGSLEAVRFGRSFRVHEKALDNYLAGSYYDAG